MSNRSMLAQDRRTETVLLLFVTILCGFDIIFNTFLPLYRELVVGWLNILYQTLGWVFMLMTLIWGGLRLFRLWSARPLMFRFCTVVWPLVATGCAVASFLWRDDELGSLILLYFISIVALVSILSPPRLRLFWNRAGVPLMKAIHFGVTLVAILMVLAQVLGRDHVFLLSALLVFLTYRFGFNRWIYAKKVKYPFRRSSPGFFIRMMSRYG